MKLRLSPEWQCYPVWRIGADFSEPVDPNDLPITSTLASDLLAWDASFQALYNPQVPQDSVEWDPVTQDNWDRQGYLLWNRLQAELGHDYEVEFYFYVSSAKIAEWGLKPKH